MLQIDIPDFEVQELLIFCPIIINVALTPYLSNLSSTRGANEALGPSSKVRAISFLLGSIVDVVGLTDVVGVGVGLVDVPKLN